MVKIIGAGLAGCEAAYYLAQKGINVVLYEMRPKTMTPAHETDMFAELVCSNSLRSNDIQVAVGLLKEEMRAFDSLIMTSAEIAQVPAGSSLAVDRKIFSDYIETTLKNHPKIKIIREEVTTLNPDELTIIAAGPLASDGLSKAIQDLLHLDHLHFFDAIAPIIDAKSIDMNIAYLKSRYDKGEAAYINCPMTMEEYEAFYEAVMQAKRVEVKGFEHNVFEGCMPFEEMAERGKETLLFGPMKPVGLAQDGKKRPHAVVQLRQDDASASMYNIVGFQTHLTWDAQKEIIRMIPGLQKADILRYGVMHRNTYIESPKLLNNCFQVKAYPNVFFAGQISGVEGYVESAASGLNAAIHMVNYIHQKPLKPLPIDTMMGAMAHYISTPNQSFVPMNANWGLVPPLDTIHKKKSRKLMYAERALASLKIYMEN